jgi:hypothetical protein
MLHDAVVRGTGSLDDHFALERGIGKCLVGLLDEGDLITGRHTEGNGCGCYEPKASVGFHLIKFLFC